MIFFTGFAPTRKEHDSNRNLFKKVVLKEFESAACEGLNIAETEAKADESTQTDISLRSFPFEQFVIYSGED